MYEIAKKNKWLRSDADAQKLLETGEYMLLADYGKDEKLLIYRPHIPVKYF